MKKIIIAIIAILAIGAGIYTMTNNDEVVDATPGTTQNRVMSIENYVTLYISELSPVPEELGGRFYVTHISAGGGKGTVSYEDGHNAYVADFTYSYEEREAIKMESFVVRK